MQAAGGEVVGSASGRVRSSEVLHQHVGLDPVGRSACSPSARRVHGTDRRGREGVPDDDPPAVHASAGTGRSTGDVRRPPASPGRGRRQARHRTTAGGNATPHSQRPPAQGRVGVGLPEDPGSEVAPLQQDVARRRIAVLKRAQDDNLIDKSADLGWVRRIYYALIGESLHNDTSDTSLTASPPASRPPPPQRWPAHLSSRAALPDAPWHLQGRTPTPSVTTDSAKRTCAGGNACFDHTDVLRSGA